MVTKYDHNKVKGFKINFSKEKGSSFGGIVLVERLAKRLGLWGDMVKQAPERKGDYDWMTIVKSSVIGLLTGSRGTYATQEIREDKSLLQMCGLSKAPEEVTFWRSLEKLGSRVFLGIFQSVLFNWVTKIILRVGVNRILQKGFLPVFGDGTLLEGSKKREGTKYIEGKGSGLLWTTLYVGPFMACQGLNRPGEGEGTLLKDMLPLMTDKVLRRIGMKKKALVLLDSLHGNGPTLDVLEDLKLCYVVGGNNLKEMRRMLQNLDECFWQDTGADASRNITESGVCYSWLHLEGWKRSRLVVGYRFKIKGEFFWNYTGVLTNLSPEKVERLMTGGMSFPEVIWELYSMKMGLENYYKPLLEDLGLHHPPCEEHRRNAGFYALGSLAYTLGLAVEMIGSKGMGRCNTKRKDGKARKRPTPRMMRIWRLIRRYFTLPAKISYHAREITVEFLEVSLEVRKEFNKFWENILRC